MLVLLLEQVVGEDDVVGVERLAVAPGHAIAQLDVQRGEVGVVLVALRQPGDELTRLQVLIEEILVHDLVQAGVQRSTPGAYRFRLVGSWMRLPIAILSVCERSAAAWSAGPAAAGMAVMTSAMAASSARHLYSLFITFLLLQRENQRVQSGPP